MPIDDLTGLGGVPELELFLAETVPSDRRRNYRTGLVILDIVKFNDYNRAYGLPQGDQALCTLAGCLSSNEDPRFGKAFRIGEKDYLAAVFENVSREELEQRAEGLKAALESAAIPRKGERQAPDTGYSHVHVDAVFLAYESGQQNPGGSDITPAQMVRAAVGGLDDKALRTGRARQIRLL